MDANRSASCPFALISFTSNVYKVYVLKGTAPSHMKLSTSLCYVLLKVIRKMLLLLVD